jgi:hypothetical protein
MKPPLAFWRVLGPGLASLLLLAGCESNSGHPVSVRGKISYQGAVVRKGTIVFSPDARRGASGPIASAEIQADGSYTLSTGGQAGAAPGWYRITITSLATGSSVDSSAPVQAAHPYLPDRYRDPELSGLVRQVRDRADNLLDFNLD